MFFEESSDAIRCAERVDVRSWSARIQLYARLRRTGVVKALEDAGAYAVEVEVIPEGLLAEISKRTTLLTSSIGGGSGGDIQFLFAEDILGNNPPPYPRHSK